MRLTIGAVLLAIAVVLFLLGAFGINLAGIDFVALGLAAFAGAFLLEKAIAR